MTAVAVVSAGIGAVGATPAQAAPACSKKAAKLAVGKSSFASRIKHSLGADFFAGQRVMQLFRVYRVHCFDLTLDGKREMVVELGCCTGSSFDPWAIFTPKDNRWRLRYSRVRTNNSGLDVDLFNSDVEGGPQLPAVEEKLPVYDSDDANCCPSGYEYEYTVWSGQRFVYGVRW